METMTLINGNGQPYTLNLPRILMIGGKINDVALAHIKENTGLDFKEMAWEGNYEAQPTEAIQIVKLFATYNFKTKYMNNWDEKNTIILKSDHYTGFDVDSICFDCVRHNGINTNGLNRTSRLAC